MNIKIRSFEPDLEGVVQLFNNGIENGNNPHRIVWSYRSLTVEPEGKDLLFSLLEEVDLILIRQSRLVYPQPEQLEVLGVIENKADLDDPFILIGIKNRAVNQLNYAFHDCRHDYGKVYIAGFGPGNPDLLTIKTERLLREADAIFYDDLLDASFLDHYSAEKHYVGKRKGQHSSKQDAINALLFEAAAKGQLVVRLKGGDPLVFGRGGEEYHYLSRRFVVAEIIPGITSALAAAAGGIIPLTSRGISTSVAFTLGHDAIHNKLPQADTLVFYMGASQQKAWAHRLQKEGWAASTPVAAVRNASLPNQAIKRYTLGQLIAAEETLPAPSLVIVGYTASQDIRAQGRRWLYTGTDVNDFKENGILVHNPMIAIRSCEPDEDIKRVLFNLSSYHRILFPTPFAVREFFKLLFEVGLDVRALMDLQISSIGEATSRVLRKYGLVVPPETTDNTAESLIQKFRFNGILNENILLPCSTKGLNLLPKGLSDLGNRIDTFAIYHSDLPDNVSRHNLDEFYGVVFTSPTTVKNFFKVYDTFPPHLKVVAGGKYTHKLLQSHVQQLAAVGQIR